MTEHQVPQQVSSLEQLLKQPHVTQIPEFLWAGLPENAD